MKKLEGRTALITGCNRGVGRAIMLAFMREGTNIVACTRKKNEEILDLYAGYEKEFGIKIYPIYFDLSDEESIKAGMKELYALKLTIDILVNNAGILNTDGLLRLKLDKAREVMQINYFATIQITQSVVKLMLRSKYASIINIGSIAAQIPTVGNTVYGASKAAILSMTTCWAKELASAKIRVNAIAPGYLDTDMTATVDKDFINKLLDDTALKRLGTVDEVANVAVFLACNDSSYVDGETINVRGGIGYD